MVFESIISEVLNKVLGSYVENLDSNNLSIGIWGGDVVLQNLVLKQSALNDLDLPIQIVYGRLGKLVLKIPWKNLYGAPVVAIIEQLWVLVVPNQQVQYDPKKEEKQVQDAKQNELRRIEAEKKKAAEEGQKNVDNTFAEKLTTQIIKNVQVRIADIHIRYEDMTTSPGRPFALGLTLSNLSIESTNDTWTPAIVTDVLSKIYKVVTLDALAFYWNCKCPMYSKSSVPDILKSFEADIATRDKQPVDYTYILGPINSSARLRLNTNPERDAEPFTLPKILLNLEMEKLAVGLTKSQFHDIMMLVESMDRMSRGVPYRKYRPFVNSYKGHYKEWWKFAYTCIVETEIRRHQNNWDWNHICKHREVCRNYAEAYMVKLKKKKVPLETLEKIEECEKLLDVTNLVIIRQKIELEVERLAKTTEEKKHTGWFSSWWGKSASDKDAQLSAGVNIMKKFEEAMTSDEKKKLYKAIDYQENAPPAAFPENFVATNCVFVLRCLEIELRDDTRVLCVDLEGVNCRLQQRPGANALQVVIKIDKLTAFGLQQGDVLPQLVSSEDFAEGEVLLDVLFETHPYDNKNIGQRIHVKSNPLKVTYDGITILELADFFKMPEALAVPQLQAAAGSKLANLKEMSATGMQYAVEKHVVMDLDVHLSAPYVVIPYGGLYFSEKPALVINLGQVTMKSVERGLSQINVRKMYSEGTTETDIMREVMSNSYDKFIIELSELQVLIANENENWRNRILDNIITPMHILQPMNLIVELQKCLVSDDPRLPKLKIAGELPSIALNISDDRVQSLLKLIASLPLAGKKDTEPAPLKSRTLSKSSIYSQAPANIKIAPVAPVAPVKKTKEIDLSNFTQATDLEVKFDMRELIVTVSKKKSKTKKLEKKIQFRCLSLELDMIQQTFNLDVVLRLGGIGLTQFRQINDVQIINTPMTKGQDEYLLTVHFTQVNKISPEFHIKYGSCEQRLNLNFTILQLQLHQESICELLLFVNDFQRSLEAVNKSQHKDKVGSTHTEKEKTTRKLSIIDENIKISKSILNTQRRKTRLVVETILFKLTADVQELDVLMATDARQLASFAVKGVKADVVIKKSYTQVGASLTDFIILDLNPESIHSKILCRTSIENAIDVQLVLYNLDKTVDFNKSDMSVRLTMGCLKFTFLNLFVSGILEFLNQFQAAQKAIKDASAAAAETAKKNVANAYENSTRIDMSINLKAPVIIVPINSTSYDGIMLDLGYIELTNNFINLDTKNKQGVPAVIDELKLYLKNLKLSRVLLDTHLEKKVDCVLLKPITLLLKIKRNLSAAWYNNIPDIDVAGELKSIELVISEADYSKFMQVLSENLGEKVHPTMINKQKELDVDAIPSSSTELKKSQELVMDAIPSTSTELKRTQELVVDTLPASSNSESRKSRALTMFKSIQGFESIKDSVSETKAPHTVLRFTFTMASFTISLYKGGTEMFDDDEECVMNHSPDDGLARFTLFVLSLKGRTLTDNSMTTSILLVDCLLDDIRSGRENNLTRLMERKQETDSVVVPSGSNTDTVTRSMIDVTCQKKQNDTFADVRVYSFNLILSTDYLMQIAHFFSAKKNENLDDNVQTFNKSVKSAKTKSGNKSQTRSDSEVEETEESTMTLNLKIEKPDIILVERMDSIDTRALILNNEVLLNVRIAGKNQTVRGSINDLQLYVCCYNPERRHETKCHLLRPCNIIIVGSTPLNKGLHLDITLSAIRISVSPAMIELLSAIQKTTQSEDVAVKNKISKAFTYYTSPWEAKSFVDSDFWFLKTEQGQEAIESMENSPIKDTKRVLKEVCNIAAASIILTMEAGVGNKTLPMLLLDTSFEATAHDWSSSLYLDASITLQMAYFNSQLAVWEPLIETVEVIHDDQIIYSPWSLNVEIRKNDQEEQLDYSPESESEPVEEIVFKQPTQCINVSSSVNLELVVTKTFLTVISNLGSAFNNAVKMGLPAKELDIAPYRVVNDSGLKVTVVLNGSTFQLYKQHNLDNYSEIVLENGAEVQLELNTSEDINAGVQIGKKSISSYATAEIEEKQIYVLVNDMKCILKLPVTRADKRYFPLNYRGENNDSWGLVSDVQVAGAETIITLRSILQVHNHFSQPVNVYYMTNRGNELEIVKQIPPNSTCNLPMFSVYTLTNELFFSLEKYCVSAAPYVWKDLQQNLSMAKTLTCPADSRSGNQAFVLQVCGEIEQIFFENTSKHTMVSTCYHVHLRPAITFLNCLPIPVVCIVQGTVNEIPVQPGEQLLMPTVNPGSSDIVIRLLNYLEKDWSCRHDILSVPPEFSVWSFDSYDSTVKMVLDLGMHCVNSKGTMIFSLYCPFWMLNKTGLMLSYRKSSKSEKNVSGSPAKNCDDNMNVLHHPEDYKHPILFSFNAKNFFGKKKASIRVESGEWSDKFSLDVAGSSGTVVCKANNRIYQIGVHNQLTYNGLTKQVTFTPFYVIINNASFVIECQELERPADPFIVVEPDSCTPLWPRTDRDDKLLKVRVGGSSSLSPPFLISEVHTVLLKLYNKYGGINVNVQVTEGGIYVTFTQYLPGLAPALVINHTNEILKIWEKESVNIKKLPSKHTVLLSWDNPTGPRILVWETERNKEIHDDLRKDGLGEIIFEGIKKLYWVSFLDGMQRILLFTEDKSIAKDALSAGDLETIENEISVSIHGLGLSIVNNLIRQEIMYIGIASSGIIWEACKMSSKRYKQLSVKECILIEAAYQQYLETVHTCDCVVVDEKTQIDFKNGLMLRPHKRKLRRTFQTGVWLQMKTSPNQKQLHAKINRLQIDNQLYECTFPVIFAPVPPPKSVAADCALKPFAELSMVQRIMKHSTVQQFKYFKILIQECHIKVDLAFVVALLDVLERKQQTEQELKDLFLKDMSLVDEPLMAHVSTQSLQEQTNFYDYLHFSPLKIHVSFSLATATSSSGNSPQSPAPAFIGVLLQGLGVTLTDMQDVVFRLSYFEREYTFLNQKQLVSEAVGHYVGQAIKQLYVLVLGLDVIGNPYGLVLGITKGVEDLFYEPFQGAIQGPGEFAEGLVLGVRSLFGHTVGGAAGAVSKITGAMGKGIAVLTFDKDYQRKRRDQLNKKPTNIHEGFARGGKGLVMGVVDGVTGVFTKPISGAKEQGVEGFFKGLGKGAMGLVTRPTGGVIDFASGSLDVLKRATEMSVDVTRLRAPRYMRGDGLVRPYCKQEADGNKLLHELEKGKYANTDIYAFHMWIIEKKDILLLTDKRMAYVVHSDVFGVWQVEWSYTWTELNTPAKVVDKGVQVQAGEAKKKVLGLFGSADNGKIIIIPDPATRVFVKNKIEYLRRHR